MAEQSHAAGVPSERGDVFANPVQRRDLVHEAVVRDGALTRVLVGVQEAYGIEGTTWFFRVLMTYNMFWSLIRFFYDL